MAAQPRAAAGRPSPLLAAALIGSILFGVAATYLAAPGTPVVGGRGAVSDSFMIVIYVSEGVFLAMLGIIVLMVVTARRGTTRIPRIPAMIMAIFLVGIGFLVAVHYASPGSGFGLVPTNQTDNSTTLPPTNATDLNNTTGPIGPLPVAGVPGWVIYLGLAIAVTVAISLLAPALRSRVGAESEGPAGPSEVRRSLETALKALASENPTGAREIIIALYAQLLSTVGPYLENLETGTPREIAAVAVTRFGIAPGPAEELTRLFEEARYSHHPFTDAQVERARRALSDALLHLQIRSYAGGA